MYVRLAEEEMKQIRRGFTLVELLVVIGVIALLIARLLPALGAAKKQAIGVKCMSQMRQLGCALSMYCMDNHGWLASADTAGPLYPANFIGTSGVKTFSTLSPTQTWVGWVDGGLTSQALLNGTLWKYIQNACIYRCPADTNDYRTRNYSMNTYLCSGTPNGVGLYFNIYKITQAANASATIAFAEECDPRTQGYSPRNVLMYQWNLNGWLQNPLAADAIPALAPTQDWWGDTIAAWHRNGANFSFLDGHVEYWHFADPRTINYLKNDPTWPIPGYYTPNNADLNRIRAAVVSWGVQRTH
jgi:prepilin-type N-terminal cleavage/methylation domain-containing protein/prepilin-type processing-associated H-X9-DG protein